MTDLALIVDDEPDLLSLLSISLRRMDVDCVKAECVGDALGKLQRHAFDLCLTDLRLPDGSGLDIVKAIQKSDNDIPVAVITAFGDPKTAVEALKSGAFDYVAKPIDVNELKRLVEAALKVRQKASPHTDPAAQLKIIGESDQIQSIRRTIAKISRNQAPVHISGETGTGKELIARSIHENGPRAGQPFVAVNCGAIPGELMENEFFGHKKGGFTGAHQDTEGLFRAADGGTLFLDEIGELPAQLQVKLLRAIQEKKIRAVGDTKEIPIDIRLISATNKNLEQMIAAGTFREDFYYRVNVIHVHAPGLRERPSDIPALCTHIIERLAEDTGGKAPAVSGRAMEKLTAYPFPGNVRELENILERAFALLESDRIEADDIVIPQRIREAADSPAALPIDEHVRQIETERIEKALSETGGNVTAAAKLLGTTFRSLRYRIKKLHIDVS